MRQTVVLVAGLPYSGKTAIIEALQKRHPGRGIFIDGIFRDLVEEKDVCLERWLAESGRLTDRIIETIREAREPYLYVEIGILQPRHRNRLINWVQDGDYRLLPLFLRCESRNEIVRRQTCREERLRSEADKLKIAIGMEELEGPITAAFTEPAAGEGFLTINTAKQIDENVQEISPHLEGV